MSKFEVLILPIDKVENHPNADRLSLNHIRGYSAVSNKHDDGTHRYHAGQLVAYIPVGAVVPESLLRSRGYWDEIKEKGFLGGPKGDRVQAINLRNVTSQGLIFPTVQLPNSSGFWIENGNEDKRWVEENAEVTDFLGVTKYQSSYAANVSKIPPEGFDSVEQRLPYEVEDLKKYPDILKGKQVIATELLHGILCVIGFDRKLEKPYFVSDGVNYRNRNINADYDNIYTQTAKPIWQRLEAYIKEMPAVERFYLFGEIIGPNIQDMTYGLETTEFRAIDVMMGLMGGGRDSIPFGFLDIKKYQLFKWLHIASVPVVWAGEFDRKAIDELANSPSTIGGGMRKGVVITAEDENFIDGRRPILKLLSDKFLLRKGGTDYK